MHEHHTVHELDAVLPAGVRHLSNVGEVHAARLLADNVFARRRRTQNPFLAQADGQRNVNGVHVRRIEQFLITAERGRLGGKWKIALAVAGISAAALRVAAGHRRNGGVAGIEDRLPVLTANFRRAQKAKSQLLHKV